MQNPCTLQQYRLGDESSFEEKDLEGPGEQVERESSCVLVLKKAECLLDCVSKCVGNSVRRAILSLSSALKTLPLEFCVQFGAL